MLPRVQPYFSVKSATHETVLQCMVAMGLGFECASKVRSVYHISVLHFKGYEFFCFILGRDSFAT